MEKKELTMELLLEFLDDKQKMELYELLRANIETKQELSKEQIVSNIIHFLSEHKNNISYLRDPFNNQNVYILYNSDNLVLFRLDVNSFNGKTTLSDYRLLFDMFVKENEMNEEEFTLMIVNIVKQLLKIK
jgi:hypothetical protein